MRLLLTRAVLVGLATMLAVQHASAQSDAPRIFLDQPERIVEYQLNRLTREQLAGVERRDTDIRYRPVYLALLMREGLPLDVRQQAAAALAGFDNTSVSRVVLEALAKLAESADAASAQVTRVLLAQPIDELSRQRGEFARIIALPALPNFATPAAYAASLTTSSSVSDIWSSAAGREGHLTSLLRAAPLLPASTPAAVRSELRALVLRALETPALADSNIRAAAITALASLRPTPEAVAAIVAELRTSSNPVVRTSAIRALSGAAVVLVPADQLETSIAGISSWVSSLAPNERASVDAIDALALAEALAARLPAERAAALRRGIRALGAKVVRISALPEQVSFDVRWFAVQGGRPVQMLLVNPDAMPHNVVVGRPGSLEAIGRAAGTMSMPTDPAVKPFVPDLPSVLFSTRLAQQDETLRLSFTAPNEPGAYVFACTFPGHWLRMYGVMLVVPDLEAFEASPVAPNDPMTGKPFVSGN